MSNIVIDIVTQFTGKKAFKEAETAASKLTGSVKKLAGAFGLAFGTRAVTQFGAAAVKAFAADDKAARVLGQTLNNLGLGFSNNAEAVNGYISRLEKQTGVLDDELRPAMDRLLRATGDITKSQELLGIALDVSAGTGKSLTQVSQSLQKGYLGQTQALGRLGVGLSKAELTSSNFVEIQARLSTLFSGQATAAANTYAGSLNKLAVASNNAKEAIGQGLVDALAALGGGGEGGLQNTLNLIEKTSTALATFIRRFGVGLGQAKALLSGDFKGFVALGQAEANRGKQASGVTPAIAAELKKAAAEKAAAKRAKELAALTNKNTKAIKEQTATQKAANLFDIEKTQILAALKGKITEDERKRLELQLAIITGNAGEASKLAYELAKSQGLTEQLARYLADFPDAKNPFAAWSSYLDKIEEQVKKIAQQIPVPAGTPTPTPSPTSTADNLYQSIVDQGLARGESQATINSTLRYTAMGQQAMGQTPVVNVQVTLDGQEMVGAVSKVQTNNYLSGKIIALERTQSSFK